MVAGMGGWWRREGGGGRAKGWWWWWWWIDGFIFYVRGARLPSWAVSFSLVRSLCAVLLEYYSMPLPFVLSYLFHT